MVAAVAIFAATVALQIAAVAALATGQRPGAEAAESGSSAGLRYQLWRGKALTVATAVAPLMHAAVLFSDSFILAEGQMLGFGLATLTVLLTRSACAASATDSVAASESQSLGCDTGVKHTETHSTAAESLVRGSERVPRQGNEGEWVWLNCRWDALCIGAILLLAYWALGASGLVKRSSHDAMWRAAAEPSTVGREPGREHQQRAATQTHAAAAVASFVLASPEVASFLAASASTAAAFGAIAVVYGPLLVLPLALLQARARLLSRCFRAETSSFCTFLVAQHLILKL